MLAACSHSTVKRALSPVIGSWQINGAVPAPEADLPQFTSLTFHTDGNLDADYVAAAGALAHVVQASPQIKHERDSYSLVGNSTLRIVEGSRALSYTYDIHDGKLFLTPANGDGAIVYRRTTTN
jgi:hypothetical protein